MVAWAGAAVAGVGCTLAGVLLVRAGLDDADKWASIIGMCIAAAGLPLAVYSIVLAHRSALPSTTEELPQTRAQPKAPQEEAGGGPVVSNSTIEGPNIQIGHADGDVDIRYER
ncbi:hypothetical protein [Microtetraspora sp. NBRC 13810]|uniref:hypothetical protein n=1 Tax=Microtetraspora sp. NBRC 13810 TaxID=3030990 RepID=UPI0025525D12|nr:hypothetical protein [Microtetraspora sp. NBRC 13810]